MLIKGENTYVNTQKPLSNFLFYFLLKNTQSENLESAGITKWIAGKKKCIYHYIFQLVLIKKFAYL